MRAHRVAIRALSCWLQSMVLPAFVWVALLVMICASSGCRDDTRYTSASRVGVDSGTPSEDTDLDPDANPPTDSGPDVLDVGVDGSSDVSLVTPASCEMEVVETTSGEVVFTCQIEVTSALGCDDFVRCLCGALPNEADLEMCVAGQTAPRGAISFADFCSRAGGPASSSLSDLAEQLNDSEYLPVPFEQFEVFASDACDRVAALSAWGTRAELEMLVHGPGVPPREIGELPNRDGTETAFVLDDIELFDPDVSWFRLTRSGVNRARGVLGGTFGDWPLEGRAWSITTRDSTLLSGQFGRQGERQIHYEQLDDDNFFWIRVVDGATGGYYDSGSHWGGEQLSTILAARQVNRGAGCLNTCSCPDHNVCVNGRCQGGPGCFDDADCCYGRCDDGCPHWPE